MRATTFESYRISQAVERVNAGDHWIRRQRRGELCLSGGRRSLLCAIAPPLPPVDPNGPSIFAALQEQLGLTLESQQAPLDVFVIDRVGRPTPTESRARLLTPEMSE